MTFWSMGPKRLLPPKPAAGVTVWPYEKRWTVAHHYSSIERFVLRNRRPRFEGMSRVLDRRPALTRPIKLGRQT